ncbi:putative P450 monooxygenase [Xylariaceae sp. FL0016]|nr:putative P450 monooxygenase [Xylariaceae sp. FL0016]
MDMGIEIMDDYTIKISGRLCLLWIGYVALKGTYNIFFHPLSCFPGPLFLGATSWRKAYLESVRQISMTHYLFELHEKYGDIVRVAPNELHFTKPDAFHDIYSPLIRWDKDPTLYKTFNEDNSSFGILTYAESKKRKDVLNPLFSRRAITQMQGIVLQRVESLVNALIRQNSLRKSADLLLAFRSFSLDTISTYCFAKSTEATGVADFGSPVVRHMQESIPMFLVLKNVALLRNLMFSLPPRLASMLSSEAGELAGLLAGVKSQIHDFMQDPDRLEKVSHETIYHRLLDPASYPSGVRPGFRDLYDEAQLLLTAGSLTIADVLIVGWFNVLDQPALYQELREEVVAAWPDRTKAPLLEDLEKLPLLTAIIKESLRVAPAVSTPLPRIVPPSGARINGTKVPGGAVVSMSIVHMHLSPEVFDNARVFRPSRWLGPDGKELEKWLVPFSRGPRMCPGSTLAWCELYLVFATLTRRLDMKLDGTTAEDMVWRDCFVPYYDRRHLHAWCEPAA